MPPPAGGEASLTTLDGRFAGKERMLGEGEAL